MNDLHNTHCKNSIPSQITDLALVRLTQADAAFAARHNQNEIEATQGALHRSTDRMNDLASCKTTADTLSEMATEIGYITTLHADLNRLFG